MTIHRSPVVGFFLVILLTLGAAQASPDAQELARGVALRNGGSLQESINFFRSLGAGGDGSVAARGELGASLLQARRYGEAEPYLREAYDKAIGSERARYAIELGNLAAARRRPNEAAPFYAEARTMAGADSTLAIVARINEARLARYQERPTLLATLSRDVIRVNVAPVRARLRLSIGTQAAELGRLQLAYENLEEARELAVQTGDARTEIDALDALAQLYEAQGRNGDALMLSRRGIARAQAADGLLADLLLQLEWRQGRLLAIQGANDEARAAYQRAIAHVESLRQDIPIQYESGRSSFRDTLEPIYLGYIDLLLKKADASGGRERDDLLWAARDTGELIKQSELQDYLGERCSIEVLQNAAHARVTPGTAIFYPIVLKDRIEIIFESSAGIVRQTTIIDAAALRHLVSTYAEKLRNAEPDYHRQAAQLYDILVRPFEKEINAQGVNTLLVVPDGVLRLLPWSALYDGQQFMVQKYSVVVNSGLSMTSQSTGDEAFTALIAGIAEPGPVIDKLSQTLLVKVQESSAPRSGQAPDLPRNQSVRKISTRALTTSGAERIALLKKEMALPGVKIEVEALAMLLPGISLLDANFTTARLQGELEKGDYHIAHLATHGFFGSTADASFIMAYDNLVTMDELQRLLQLEGVRKNPIELLTLSACETAEGDDRSPLGIAGAAIKAKAKSVLGTLWPVSDEATQRLMQSFYSGLVRDRFSKAEALRRAQVEVIKQRDLEHPFFWAPFIIVGDWR